MCAKSYIIMSCARKQSDWVLHITYNNNNNSIWYHFELRATRIDGGGELARRPSAWAGFASENWNIAVCHSREPIRSIVILNNPIISNARCYATKRTRWRFMPDNFRHLPRCLGRQISKSRAILRILNPEPSKLVAMVYSTLYI